MKSAVLGGSHPFLNKPGLNGEDFQYRLIFDRSSLSTYIISPYTISVSGCDINVSAIICKTFLCSYISSAQRKQTTSPVAIIMPLLNASYNPLSFSEIHFNDLSLYVFNISTVLSVDPPSTMIYSLSG